MKKIRWAQILDKCQNIKLAWAKTKLEPWSNLGKFMNLIPANTDCASANQCIDGMEHPRRGLVGVDVSHAVE